MDNQDSTWLNRPAVIGYPNFGVSKPPTPLIAPAAESLGPMTLNDSQGKLTSRWWAVWQVATNVVIASDDGGEYGSESIVFAEPGVIQMITLTFDQLGRPAVFYKLSTNELKLYWYDPVLGDNTITNIGLGNYPVAIFDYPQDTSQPFTDVVIFYIGTDTQVKYRKQRDRYQVEYGIPGSFGSQIVTAGLTRENRVQVVYR